MGEGGTELEVDILVLDDINILNVLDICANLLIFGVLALKSQPQLLLLDVTQQILHLRLVLQKLTVEPQQREGNLQAVAVRAVVLLEHPLELLQRLQRQLADALRGQRSQLLFGLGRIWSTDDD